MVRVTHAEALLAAERWADARIVIREAHSWLFSRASAIDDDQLRHCFLNSVRDNARILRLAERWLGPEPDCSKAP